MRISPPPPAAVPLRLPAARALARPVGDPATRLLVDRALLVPPPGPPVAVAVGASEAAFRRAATSFAFRAVGVPTPLLLRAAPGLARFAAERGVDEVPLRFALAALDQELRAAVGAEAFAGLSLLLTARDTLPKLLDAGRPGAERGLAGLRLVASATTALALAYPRLGPWAELLGVAAKVGDGARVAYLGYRAYGRFPD